MAPTGNWDGRISRRTLLRAGGSATAAYVLLGRAAASSAAPPFASNPFGLGVASGDPTPDGVVLWTRLAPDPLAGGGMSDDVFGVRYEVATDERFQRIVRRGAVEARPEEAHTVHVELAGLQPDTPYWYRFKWGRTTSRIGRTRTAPPLGSTAPMRFAFASCQNYTNGFYPAYADMAQQELDLVVHLGDYIYEGEGTGVDRVRDHAPVAELFSLTDYRTRHAQYRTDPDLQAAHAAFPWLMTWDDHEFKNNYADLDIDQPDTPLQTIAERRAAAYLAYWEHAPLARARKPVFKDMALYRRLQWGALATFHVLDTRQHRSNQIVQCPPSARDPSGYCPDALSPDRSILGPVQREWLIDGLRTRGHELERPRQPGRVRADRHRFVAAAAPLRPRALGRLRRRPPGRAQRPGRARRREHGGHHRRLARELGPQRAARLPQLRRAADRHGVPRHVDQHRGRHRQ